MDYYKKEGRNWKCSHISKKQDARELHLLHQLISARKPLILPQSKKKRLQKAKQHEQLTGQKCVHWTNESKFIIFGSKRRVVVLRKFGERMMK